MCSNMSRVNIIGAGLAGLSAAVTLAEKGCSSNLISLQPSERAQSVLAEGGINAALNTMGEDDEVANHFQDTMAGGVWLADPNAVKGLTTRAPEIVYWLKNLGVPFHQENGVMIQRNFGGQKKKRTAYAKSSTGKVLVSALIDEVRKYEAAGIVHRYPHHEFIKLLLEGGRCRGVRIRDTYTGKLYDVPGVVLLASGGLAGVFPEMTTGTVQNTGDVTATVFAQGVRLSNLEMIQYHPTTIGISGKRCLVTEAARGEGGRLYIRRDGQPWYFMEEKYPELKNLMPRDVVSREMFFVSRREDTDTQVYLDMTGLSDKTWSKKLSDLREEIMHYLALDPAKEPIPVEPGIHYFMGGIDTDICHRTNVVNLYASGECTSQYHGANRLGGNSLLGAVYGGKVAAEQILTGRGNEAELSEADITSDAVSKQPAEDAGDCASLGQIVTEQDPLLKPARGTFVLKLRDILLSGLGIVRSEETMKNALDQVEALSGEAINEREKNRILLAKAMLISAMERKESRGAHYREDYPERIEECRKKQVAFCVGSEIRIGKCSLPSLRTDESSHHNAASDSEMNPPAQEETNGEGSLTGQKEESDR